MSRISHRIPCRVADMTLGVDGRLDVFAAHRSMCLRCQAEHVRQRRLERRMRALARTTVAAPAGLSARIVDRLESHQPDGSTIAALRPRSWVVPSVAAAACAVVVAFAKRAQSAV